ncbi:IS4 family transposase [Mesorhizobium sp. AR02]|uniref:IS4 family transposase n=1 Tax=Mesorhizobium sp. AR02 TaxID=2865837 RepID=UPI0021601469|nr:IS4 family transposase [Mesorhizobium sp. AR02]
MLLDRMVARQDICLRRLGEGRRAQEVGFHRLLANDKVTIERLIQGWSEQTVSAAAERHVLAIQDTSEITFATTPERRRGLGEIGKGGGRGVLVHAMVAIDAVSGGCLGLVAGSVYTRKGRVETPHAKRSLKDKESRRWIDTALQARSVLAKAATVTIVADRESDIYAEWATLPGGNVHLLTRVMHDRAVAGGGTLSSVTAALPFVAARRLELLATHKRAARSTQVSLRFSKVEVCRPDNPGARDLPKTVTLNLVEVVELGPPAAAEPVHWRLLTTHEISDVAAARQIVDWYRRRWTIEQLFRLMKTHGLRLEDSQLASAEVLVKLAAIATKAAAVILQLVQAREGIGGEHAANAFSTSDIAVLDSLDASYQGRTALQNNPHPRHSLAWAAWIIARLGGWNGYPSSKPPGPITFRHGLEYFRAIAKGWELRDVCIP